MERVLDHDLKEISKLIKKMAEKVEYMLDQSMRALSERNSDLAQNVIHQDKEVDELELQVDEAVHQLIALRQPAASDLRVAIAAIKINTDLERMGDYCEAICRQIVVLNNYGPLKQLERTPDLANIVRGMVFEAIESYTENDIEKAKSVILQDDKADALYHELKTELQGCMKSNVATIEVCSAAMLINSRLERIADQATNICEEVIFTVTGSTIKHRKGLLWQKS